MSPDWFWLWQRLPHRLIGRKVLLAAFENLLRPGGPSEVSVILFGIDRFKLINNRVGRAAADRVRRRVGLTAANALSGYGLVGHWGGDQFLCLIPGPNAARGPEIAETLRARIATLIVPVPNGVTPVTCSFGVARCPENGTNSGSLTAQAEEALYEAKRAGRNRIVVARGRRTNVYRIGSVVETALREERIMPAYQPIHDLATTALVAEEALARIVSTDGRVIGANEFIDAASRLQLTHKIDRTIVTEALARCAAHRRGGRTLPVFVNVSANLLRHPDSMRELLRAAEAHCVPGTAGNACSHPLVLEITERELLGDPPAARRLLGPFVELGLNLALDDFGSGYSSFHYLADLPVAYLKIDGALIQRVQEPRVYTIVRGIHETAHALGLTTLAEYVENERLATILREIGIDWAQGHYFSAAEVDENEAHERRRLSVNWSRGYYYGRS